MGKNNIPKPTEDTKVVEQKVEAIKEEIAEAKVDGVVNMLNVRSTPEKKEGNIVTQIQNGVKVQVVDPKKSTGEWYKIIVTDKEKKTDGYVMKKYIKII